MDRGDVERLFHVLVAEEILKEDLQVNKAGYTSAYIKVGRRADMLGKRDRHGDVVKIVLGLATDRKKIPTAADLAAGKGKKPKENVIQKLRLGPVKGKPIRVGKQQFVDEPLTDEDEDEIRITRAVQNHITAKAGKQKASTSKRDASKRDAKLHDSEDDGEWLDDGADDEDGGPDGGWRNEIDDDEFVVPDGQAEETAGSSSDSDNDDGADSDCELVSSKESKETWTAATQTVKAKRGNDPTAELYEELKACVERVGLLSSTPGHALTAICRFLPNTT